MRTRSLVAVATVIVVVASGCTDESTSAPPGDHTSLGCAAMSAAFADPPAHSAGGRATIRPLEHPLLAELLVESTDPVLAAVRMVGPLGPQRVPIPTSAARSHAVLLAGMRAETTYTVQTTLLDESCEPIARLEDLSHTTGRLPEGLPDLEVTSSDHDRMAPGLTLFNLLDLRDEFAGRDPAAGELPPPAGWIVIVDEAGEVVWYHHQPHGIGDVRMLGDGTILHEYNDTAARRIDLRGHVLQEWAGTIITGRLARDAHGRRVVGDDPIVVDVESMHHEHTPLPDGTHATLSTELQVFEGFTEPQCGEDPASFDGTYHLIGDVVAIFDPESGEVLERFSLFDHFDPRSEPDRFNLCGLPLPFVFPNWLYHSIDDQARDWTHANAIEVDEANNALLVSIRHLDAIIALRWKDDAEGPAGELLWHSGPLGDLELTSGEWHRHQHAPEVQDDGSVLLYDNGNDRPGRGTDAAPLYSRAVLYDIDPDAGTVTQLWEHRSRHDGRLVFAPFVGDADRLENGNVLVTDGGINGAGPHPALSAQVVEVVPRGSAGGDVVFDLDVMGGVGWVVYRSERIPSMYGR